MRCPETFHDVVDPPEQPEVAVGVAFGAVPPFNDPAPGDRAPPRRDGRTRSTPWRAGWSSRRRRNLQ
jgi:hypothetical protein